MKWKSLLTIEEASMIGAGLTDSYTSQKDLNHKLSAAWAKYEEGGASLDSAVDEGGDYFAEYCVAVIDWGDFYKIYEHWMAAHQIKESLVHDLQCIIDGSYVDSPLEILSPSNFIELDATELEGVVCSKISLAKWFGQHDINIAKLFYPGFTEQMFHQTKLRPSSILKTKAVPLASKSENAYNRTVKALAEALVGGLTGRHYADAEVIAAALASKGIKPPVCNKVLAGYLKNAS